MTFNGSDALWGRKYPGAIVARSQALREQGLTYLAVVAALEREFNVRIPPSTAYRWRDLEV